MTVKVYLQPRVVSTKPCYVPEVKQGVQKGLDPIPSFVGLFVPKFDVVDTKFNAYP